MNQHGLIHKLFTIATPNTSISYPRDILASRHGRAHSDDPAQGARTHTIFSLSKLTPSGSWGVLSFISSKTFTTRSATTRFRYLLWFAGMMYQGAHSVLVVEMTSSNDCMYSSQSLRSSKSPEFHFHRLSRSRTRASKRC